MTDTGWLYCTGRKQHGAARLTAEDAPIQYPKRRRVTHRLRLTCPVCGLSRVFTRHQWSQLRAGGRARIDLSRLADREYHGDVA